MEPMPEDPTNSGISRSVEVSPLVAKREEGAALEVGGLDEHGGTSVQDNPIPAT